jgi:maleate isomerase
LESHRLAAKATRIGLLTPSSNTVLEPVVAEMIRDLPDVSAHFSRFKVTEIALSAQALGQFADAEILGAASLLADAKVDVISWIGTSASWLGFERDEQLVKRLRESTGIKACTCVLAFQELLRRSGIRRVGLVTPYTGDVQDRIAAVWGAAGFNCDAERHLDIRDNFAFGEVTGERIETMIRDVAKRGVEAVAVVCTNLRGAPLVPQLEQELGIPILDSVAVTIWKCLTETGISTAPLEKWGRVFKPL